MDEQMGLNQTKMLLNSKNNNKTVTRVKNGRKSLPASHLKKD
jgi:hypothetical protein